MAVEVLLTCCPPAPCARMAVISSSPSGIATCREITIMKVVARRLSSLPDYSYHPITRSRHPESLPAASWYDRQRRLLSPVVHRPDTRRKDWQTAHICSDFAATRFAPPDYYR